MSGKPKQKKQKASRYVTTRHYFMICGCSTVIIASVLGMCGLSWLPSYVLGINVVTYCLYCYDKNQATKQGSRIPELVLHVLALLGGSIGAILGQEVFHHKTCKESFRRTFMLIVFGQLTLCVILVL